MADSGNTPSTGGGVSLTSKTSILGQKLYVIIIVTVIIVTVVLLLILFCIRRNSNAKRRRRMHVKQSSGLLPLVSGPINEESIEKTSKLNEFEKEDDGKDEIKVIKPIVKVVESNLGFTNSGSNESGTSRSDGAASSVSAENLSNLGWGRWYGLNELEIATSNFATENVIGEGGYGIVYRGVVRDGTVVAVKNLLNNK
ncbi:putative non-specific serine/threonine protein kinase [Helianthus annuus]|nr:putative non-specific serine/threonine protein kinase [Helianthus annuus]